MSPEEKKGLKDANVDSMPQFQRQAQFDNDSSHMGSIQDAHEERKGLEDLVHQSGVMIVGMNQQKAPAAAGIDVMALDDNNV